MTRQCPVTYCRATVPDKDLMCLKHWRMVPTNLRRDIWHHYSPNQIKGVPPSQAYMRAAQNAVAAVEEKLKKKAERNDSLDLF